MDQGHFLLEKVLILILGGYILVGGGVGAAPMLFAAEYLGQEECFQ